MEIKVASMHEGPEGLPGRGQRGHVLPLLAVMLLVFLRGCDVWLTRHGNDGGDEVWFMQVLGENERTLTLSACFHFLDLIPRVNGRTEDGDQSKNFSICSGSFDIHRSTYTGRGFCISGLF